jgi:hypothetical protein
LLIIGISLQERTWKEKIWLEQEADQEPGRALQVYLWLDTISNQTAGQGLAAGEK